MKRTINIIEPHAKLNPFLVQMIRRSGASVRALADALSISPATISRIKSRKSWAWVKDQ